MHYKATERYLKMNEQTNLQIRKIRHDINNHIINIKNILSDRDDDKINEYINGIIEDLDDSPITIRSGNAIADIVLNQKLNEARKNNIDIAISAVIPPDTSINPADLSSILFNSIDNAMEASLKIDDIDKRKIKINIHPKKDYLYFEIINNVRENHEFQKGITLKENKEEHGYGLIILEDITNKYDGFMNYEIVDNEFTLYMIVSLGKKTTNFTKKATSIT